MPYNTGFNSLRLLNFCLIHFGRVGVCRAVSCFKYPVYLRVVWPITPVLIHCAWSVFALIAVLLHENTQVTCVLVCGGGGGGVHGVCVCQCVCDDCHRVCEPRLRLRETESTVRVTECVCQCARSLSV